MLENLFLFVLVVYFGFYLLSKFDFKRLWKIKKKKRKKKQPDSAWWPIGREAQTGQQRAHSLPLPPFFG
jgi:hypothetical protein